MNTGRKMRAAIKYQIDKGVNDFVIYPFGENGLKAKEILNKEFGVRERCIVDNVLCGYNPEIKSMEDLKEIADEDFKLLLAGSYEAGSCAAVRQQIPESISMDRIVDMLSPSTYFNPFAYCEPVWAKDVRHSVIECISREIYKNGIEGAVAEAGVYKGETARYINYFFPDRTLYLFDSFMGFNQEEQVFDDKKGMHNVKYDYSGTTVDGVKKRLPYLRNCVVKAGFFPQSAEGVNDKFVFVRLDMDLYLPTKAGLDFFYPKMVKGGFICIHDCRSPYFDGARRALDDFCRENNVRYLCLPDQLGTAVLCV